MSNSQDTAGSQSSGGRATTADTQALIGLLENLVPLLLQLQTQSFPGPGYGPGHFGPPSAPVEQQAAVAFTEDIILDALRNLSAYLQKNGGRNPGLESYASVVSEAKRALAARDYQRALGLIFEAYRAVAILRAIRPELPPVRQRASDENLGGESVH